MKRLFLILFVVYPFFLYASIEKIEIDGIYYNIDFKEKTAEVTYYGDHWLFLQKPYEQKEIKIPSVITYGGNSYNVIRIGEGAFYDCKTLSLIELPETITEIGNYAFANCLGLKDVAIPQNVTLIGEAAFKGCKTLMKIVIPEKVYTVGASAFENCDALRSVSLSEGLTEISSYSFGGCKNLGSVVVPNRVKTIKTGAFQNCSKLSDVKLSNSIEVLGDYVFYCDSSLVNIELPSSVNIIGNYAFQFCERLSNINLPDNIQEIGAYTFANTILQNIKLPTNLTVIHSYTFYNCTELSTIDFPSNLQTIGEYAFYGCTSLTDFDLPEGLFNINKAAFYGCKSITSLTVPSSVSFIMEKAFDGCNLDYVLLNNIKTNCLDVFSSRSYKQAILYVPLGVRNEVVYDTDFYLFDHIKEFATSDSELSNIKSYTVLNRNSFRYLIYDDMQSKKLTMGSYYDIDEHNTYHNWAVITEEGQRYLYNIGALQYAVSDSHGNLNLTTEKEPIEMKNTENGYIIGYDNGEKWYFVENSQNKNVGTGTKNGSLLRQENHDSHYYMLNGVHIEAPQKGVLIERGDNGIVRKVLK